MRLILIFLVFLTVSAAEARQTVMVDTNGSLVYPEIINLTNGAAAIDGGNITTGIVEAAWIDDDIARDSELTALSNALTTAYVAADAALSNALTIAYIAADNSLSNSMTTAYIAADNALSNSMTTAYIAADNALSNSLTTAYVAADAALSNALTIAYIAADNSLSNSMTTAYIAADNALSNSMTTAYIAADNALSNSLTTAYVAADAALSNALTIAYIAADNSLSNVLSDVDSDLQDQLDINATNHFIMDESNVVFPSNLFHEIGTIIQWVLNTNGVWIPILGGIDRDDVPIGTEVQEYVDAGDAVNAAANLATSNYLDSVTVFNASGIASNTAANLATSNSIAPAVANWSTNPAVSDVPMAGYNINYAGNITATQAIYGPYIVLEDSGIGSGILTTPTNVLGGIYISPLTGVGDTPNVNMAGLFVGGWGSGGVFRMWTGTNAGSEFSWHVEGGPTVPGTEVMNLDSNKLNVHVQIVGGKTLEVKESGSVFGHDTSAAYEIFITNAVGVTRLSVDGDGTVILDKGVGSAGFAIFTNDTWLLSGDGFIGSSITLSAITKAWQAGQLLYDDTENVFFADGANTNVRVRIGQQYGIPFYNGTGSLLPQGSAIGATTTTNNIFKGVLFDTSSDWIPYMGLVADEGGVADGNIGIAVYLGKIEMDTIGFDANELVYATTNGLLSSTQPLYPCRLLIVGMPLTSATNGLMQAHTVNRVRRNASKSYSFTSQGIGAGVYYRGGFYDFSSTDANLTQAATNQTYGSANVAYAAHASIVAATNGVVDAGTVGILVSGTSITDQGVRTADDVEIITTNITSVMTNQYVETVKKWIGQIEYQLYESSGSPAAYNFDFNYGFSKYEDAGNIDFTVTDVEVVGLAGASDIAFNIEMLHHKSFGWTYAASGFTAGDGAIVAWSEMSPEDNLGNGVDFAWKRDDLQEFIDGDNNEGIIFRITTGQNNSVQSMDLHLTGVSEELQ